MRRDILRRSGGGDPRRICRFDRQGGAAARSRAAGGSAVVGGEGEWEKAHTIVMNDDSREAAWVHAYLHRVEGDLPNAGYWYRTAGQPVASGELAREWGDIAGALLGRS